MFTQTARACRNADAMAQNGPAHASVSTEAMCPAAVIVNLEEADLHHCNPLLTAMQ